MAKIGRIGQLILSKYGFTISTLPDGRFGQVMSDLRKIEVSTGVFWIEAPSVGSRILCGCPADSVKHLMKGGLIGPRGEGGVLFETGPNAILLSDVMVQNGAFSNLAEFPVLQMLYRQGMLLPGHPGNTGAKPLLLGSRAEVTPRCNISIAATMV